MLIDKYLPRWDVSEYHQISIDLPPQQAYQAVKALDLGRSRLIRVLLTLRGLPHEDPMTLETLRSIGFVVLEDDPPTEIVLGLVGRFWRMRGGIRKSAADDFVSFADPGFVKAAWNFRVQRVANGSIVSTETRVMATDDASRRSFRRYWFFIGPFSALVRREALRLIKH